MSTPTKIQIKQRLKKSVQATLTAVLAMSAAQIAFADTASTAAIVIEHDVSAVASVTEPNIVLAQLNPGEERRIIVKSTGQVMRDDIRGPSINIDAVMSEALSGISGAGLSIGSAKSIKNAPYSAEVISEKIQTLSDGNQIVKRTSSLAYRDSAGRTRQETRDDKNEVRSIHINDAVENTRYILSPIKKSATKITIDKDIGKRIEEMRAQGMTTGRNVITTAGGKSISVHTMASGKTTTTATTTATATPAEITVTKNDDGTQEIHTAITLSGSAAHSNPSAMQQMAESLKNNAMALAFSDGAYAAKATTRELGSKSFDGVIANGKQSSYTIPAGEIGNKNPITVSTETWYSPDLQVTVYSKKSDPRSGETIYRLANVKRNEQPLTLFSVPSDYAVKDSPAIFLRSKEVGDLKELKELKEIKAPK